MGDFSHKPSTHELISCLTEMKKEITRLQKGTGGLEDLQCKLEQSKIKQKYLHSLYTEEQNQKKVIENYYKELQTENQSLMKKIEELNQLISNETQKTR